MVGREAHRRHGPVEAPPETHTHAWSTTEPHDGASDEDEGTHPEPGWASTRRLALSCFSSHTSPLPSIHRTAARRRESA